MTVLIETLTILDVNETLYNRIMRKSVVIYYYAMLIRSYRYETFHLQILPLWIVLIKIGSCTCLKAFECITRIIAKTII